MNSILRHLLLYMNVGDGLLCNSHPRVVVVGDVGRRVDVSADEGRDERDGRRLGRLLWAFRLRRQPAAPTLQRVCPHHLHIPSNINPNSLFHYA